MRTLDNNTEEAGCGMKSVCTFIKNLFYKIIFYIYTLQKNYIKVKLKKSKKCNVVELTIYVIEYKDSLWNKSSV